MALNSNQVKSRQAGMHADGGGLYLVVRNSGERLWAFRFTDLEGKRAQMEFARVGDRDSPARDVLTLSSARDEARAFKVALKRSGIDPRTKKRLNTTGCKTVLEFANEHYPIFCVGLNPEEPKQWQRAIRDMAELHKLKVADVTTEHARDALAKIWTEKPVTANRVRQRFERLFDAAKALKLRSGDNPFVWRGNLKHLLRQPTGKRGLHRKKHYTALDYAKAPALMTALRFDTGNAARCVEVGILTVSRSQEIRKMEWSELDFDAKTWRIPADKMKIKQDETGEAMDHVVPLSDQAIEIIKSMPRTGKYVFPSDAKQQDEHAPFLANALVGAINRAGFKVTMHGMRSTFRNWGGDNKNHNFAREVLEHCLAHREGDRSERSYWTSDMIERRRVALQAWADYLKPPKPKAAEKRPSLTLVA